MDYVEEMVQKNKNIDLTKQAAFSLASAIMIDIVWGRAAYEVLDEKKAHKVFSKAWTLLGEYSGKVMQMELGLARVTSFDELKTIIKSAYQSWLLPLDIIEDNEKIFKYQVMACPFPFYGVGLFEVEEGDHTCVLWKEASPIWLNGIIKQAGLSGQYRANIDSAICCGDKTCLLTVERVKG